MAVVWKKQKTEWGLGSTKWIEDEGNLSEVDDETFARAIREGREEHESTGAPVGH